FASNWKGAATTVFSGQVTFPAVPAYARPPSPPDAPLPFTTPYVNVGLDPLLWEAYIQATVTPTSGTNFHERGYVTTSVSYTPGMLGTGCTVTGGSNAMNSAGTISPTQLSDNLSY